MKKIPLRTCVVSKEKLDKRDLIRIVKDKEGNVFIDETGKSNGRGVYLKKDANIIDIAQKKDALSYHLGVKVSKEIYEQLKTKI